MSNLIERVRYYDGEFLRSFDFDAEQTYHVEMRRRLNRSLHLYGIVEGLELKADTQGGITQVSILPGMAIDAFGREIYVFAPYTLGDADIKTNRISGDGIFDVWLRYSKTSGTPPSQGYGSCNGTNQNTRWLESYAVILLPTKTVPFTDPLFEEPDPDDPPTDHVGVLLGTVSVSPGSVTDRFANPTFDDRRVFLGLRAQRIRPPIDAISGSTPYPILGTATKPTNSALDPPTSVGIEANLFAEQNVIVGDDFRVEQGNIKPPVSGTYPNPTGNVKVASDLFVNGNVYWNVLDSSGVVNWLAFDEYVKKFMPDILFQNAEVVVPVPTGSGSLLSDKKTFSFTSKLAEIGSANAFASVTGFTLEQTNLATLFFGPPVQLNLTFPVDVVATGKNTRDIVVHYTVGPVQASPTPLSAITKFNLCVWLFCFARI